MIPVSRPSISDAELELVTDAVRSGWVSSLGVYLDKFERSFADYCGVEHAISVSNGTVGLHLALCALGIGPGDEVIVPDLTFVASANAVRTAGATPVIVDVCRDTYCIDPAAVENAITGKTKAIMPVHLYGHPADMQKILQIAQSRGLKVIEDAAEAHGASIGSSKAGAFGDCGVFSFYGNKIITTGEGGMITTNDSALEARVRLLRDHAMSKETRYWHTEVGFNYRMTNLQAALGLAQMRQIDQFLAARSKLLTLYKHRLEPHGIELNPNVGCNPVVWLVTAILPGVTREKRDQIISDMHQHGVDTRPFFYPLTMLPMYQAEANPVAHALSKSGLNLPTFVGMTEDQVETVCETLLRAVDRCS